MKSKTVIVSALLHVAVFGLALQISAGRAARRATTVAVVGKEKKKEEKKEDKPKPKPKPMVASTKPIAPMPSAATPKVAPTPTPAPEAAAPADTNIEMSNDVGLDVGGPVAPKQQQQQQAQQQQTQQKQKTQPVKKEKVLAPAGDNPETDDCTEAPSKPVPMQRPSEIEYTQEARANNVEGRLVLKITIGADGSVISVEVVSSVDAQLDAAAIAAVKTWVFKPSMRCGKAMAGGVFTLARRFELGD